MASIEKRLKAVEEKLKNRPLTPPDVPDPPLDNNFDEKLAILKKKIEDGFEQYGNRMGNLEKTIPVIMGDLGPLKTNQKKFS